MMQQLVAAKYKQRQVHFIRLEHFNKRLTTGALEALIVTLLLIEINVIPR